MSDSDLPDVMLSRSGRSSGMGKCTEEVKTQVPEELKQDIIALATINGQTVSEYVRDLLFIHVHGQLHAVRLRAGGG